MGLFTSRCKKCNGTYHWFLISHGFTCEYCGTKNTFIDLEDSWHKELDREQEYREMLKKYKK